MEWMTDLKWYILNEAGYWSRRKAFRKCSYGDKNAHKKYRVLCNKDKFASAQGLLSTVAGILPNIIEARLHGYIPVIDLCKNSRCQPMLQERYLAKKENAWEYYFTQPDKGITLEEVRKSKYVEVQIKSGANLNYYIGDKRLQPDIRTRLLSNAVCKNIHLQPEIRSRVLREKNLLFSQTDRVLGVGIRAGYRAGILRNLEMFNGHPFVGSCTDCIGEIEKRLKKWKYDSFFLAIDDREYLEEIKKYFGKDCIYLERPRVHYFQSAMQDMAQLSDDKKMVEFENISIRKKNEDYLIELYLLSQCESLYASRGTGHNFSYLLNAGRYSHVEFENLGEFQYAK